MRADVPRPPSSGQQLHRGRKRERESNDLGEKQRRAAASWIMQHGRWYAKVALFSASVGAGMEYFMIRTGFYEKVVDLEAQRRAEELQSAKEQLDASGMLQQQQQPSLSTLGNLVGKEQ